MTLTQHLLYRASWVASIFRSQDKSGKIETTLLAGYTFWHHVIILLPFSLPLYFSFALPLSIHSSSVSFCLWAFFTIMFSPSSRPDSFYLPTFFAKILSSSSTSNALSLAIVFVTLSVLTLALCRSPSLRSLLKTCLLHAKFSLRLFVDIIAFVSCNKKL